MKPFEICSIRPPTENYSLTFRLTRNCYWNRCAFCPAYKFGGRFSKRGLEEVKEDIRRAKLVDDLIREQGILRDSSFFHAPGRVQELLERAKGENGEAEDHGITESREVPQDLDPLIQWFLPWFKQRPTMEDCINHVLSWRMGGGRTCFLGDSDSLILKPNFMVPALEEVRKNFPSLGRYTIYGRTKSAARLRSLEDLKAFREAGLDRVHFGIESGCDRVLKFVKKGVTGEEHVEGCLKTKEAGLSCSVYVMPGLGGKKWSEEHALDTAQVISRISPDYVRLRSTQVFLQTPLHEAVVRGEFSEAGEEEVVKEIRIMVKNIDSKTKVISDSASNLLNVNGNLPEDRKKMLLEIDKYLALSSREKLIFSLKSRLQAFIGQYGGLTPDIWDALAPYKRGSELDVSPMQDDQVVGLTRLIRSKLMP